MVFLLYSNSGMINRNVIELMIHHTVFSWEVEVGFGVDDAVGFGV